MRRVPASVVTLKSMLSIPGTSTPRLPRAYSPSVFSRKKVQSMPSFGTDTGRTLANRSNSRRMATLALSSVPPLGVSVGPFSSTSQSLMAASTSSGMALPWGNSLMLGPRSTSNWAASSGAAGASTALSSMRNRSGRSTWRASSPKSRGSVISPVRAAATAVSGDTRYTLASAVPLRPSKLRLKVRRLTPPELGEKPMPMQGPQAHSSSRAPEARMSDRAPQLASMVRTCREPGDTNILTEGDTVLPFSMAAGRSSSFSVLKML